ncbi:NAD-dependent epimerase/dehydratase family protein [Nocardia wallacei]|uniref:NAD-dependent epimerase/dehydratase family protein n=1 Tax=Nocardia wallacei TaxID=480035 RepID=UPI002454A317|nr:NAD(P)-dependent oxidoreductase [Nocardia wallacei]
MRILLAGATGAIGQPLLRALTSSGHEVVALIRNRSRDHLVHSAGGTAVVADVMRREQLLHAVDGLRVDAVVHQATALRGAPPRLRDDDPTNALRHTGTANLLEVAHAVGARRFVTQSMILGYGYTDHGDRVLTEDDTFGKPCGSYADSVIEGLRAAEQQVCDADWIEGIALRYGLFYGPGAFSDMFADMMRRRRPCVPSDGGGINCWIHVADAAAATVAALTHGSAGQVYNIVDDEPITWKRFASAVSASHHTPRARAMPRWLLGLAAPYLACLMTDTSMRVANHKAHRDLAWKPVYGSVEKGLK